MTLVKNMAVGVATSVGHKFEECSESCKNNHRKYARFLIRTVLDDLAEPGETVMEVGLEFPSYDGKEPLESYVGRFWQSMLTQYRRESLDE